MRTTTALRHPLASKRCIMKFSENGEDTYEVFELFSQYEAVGPISQGTYGFVCSARDMDLDEKFAQSPPEEFLDSAVTSEEKEEIRDQHTLVAIKKLRQLFENNQPRMWLCATREIQLMMSFNHDNVMSAKDFFIPLGGVEMMTYESILTLRSNFDSVYIVMKKMDYTLREVMDASFVYEHDLPKKKKTTKAMEETVKEEEEEEGEDKGDDAKPSNDGNDDKAAVVSSAHINSGGQEGEGVEEGEDDNGTRNKDGMNEMASTSKIESPTTGESDEDDADGDEVERGAEGRAEGNEKPLRCPTTGLVLHPLTKDYRKFILYQIFRGVGYMHLCPVIHRDLKPENIMLDRSYTTCVTDFGQGRDVGVGGGEFVQTVLDNCTQWYAAPETLTVAVQSSTGFIDHASFHSVDVWSIGCIAAEMLIGRPLFYTVTMGGLGQLKSIVETLGAPSKEAVNSIADYRDEESRQLYFLVMENVLSKCARAAPSSPPLRELLKSPFGDEDDDEIELICKCLAWDPHDRINIQAALESHYFVKEGYEPIIDPEDSAKRVPSVRPEDISEAVSGRAFLWELFVKRHPEVGELWNSLVSKHDEDKVEHEARRAEEEEQQQLNESQSTSQ